MAQNRLPTKTASSDPCPVWNLFEVLVLSRDQSIERIFPFADNRDMQAFRLCDRYILHRVDREIDTTLKERMLQFFQKETFAALFRERHVQSSVPLGGDADEFH